MTEIKIMTFSEWKESNSGFKTYVDYYLSLNMPEPTKPISYIEYFNITENERHEYYIPFT